MGRGDPEAPGQDDDGGGGDGDDQGGGDGGGDGDGSGVPGGPNAVSVAPSMLRLTLSSGRRFWFCSTQRAASPFSGLGVANAA